MELRKKTKNEKADRDLDFTNEHEQALAVKIEKNTAVRNFMRARRNEIQFGHFLLLVILIAGGIVATGTYMFYHDPRNKYDIARPGRVIKNFTTNANATDESAKKILTAEQIKAELDNLVLQQKNVNSYGSFESAAISNDTLIN